MTNMLADYAAVAGEDVVQHLQQLAKPLQGKRVIHVNSTRVGGGVAEILEKLVPLSRDLGVDAHWEVISGSGDFYQCTKAMHNGLQGNRVTLSDDMIRAYLETNEHNAEQLRSVLEDADFVFIHDPQPAALLQHYPDRKGKWITPIAVCGAF